MLVYLFYYRILAYRLIAVFIQHLVNLGFVKKMSRRWRCGGSFVNVSGKCEYAPVRSSDNIRLTSNPIVFFIVNRLQGTVGFAAELFRNGFGGIDQIFRRNMMYHIHSSFKE